MGLGAGWGYHSDMPYPAKKPRQDAFLRFVFRHLGHRFPRLAGHLFYHLWFRVRRLEGRQSPQIMARAGFTCEDWPVAGKRIKIYACGQGPVVVLVHGWSGHAGQYQAWVQALLEAGFRVLAFDAPGHGGSSSNHTHLLEIESILRRIQAREGEFHAVVAHSYGGVVAAHALREGLRAGCLLGLAMPADARRLVERTAVSLALPAAALAEFDRLVAARFGSHWWQRISPINNVASLGIPGMLVHDRRDRIVPVAEAERLHRCWPGSRLLLTEGLGHTRLLRSDSVIAQGLAFLCGQKAAEHEQVKNDV